MRSGEPPSHSRLAFLCLTALGVVYGDIGTSPLYAIRECFYGPHAVAPTHEHVLGVLSLIFWALVIVISIKYLAFVLRAHNDGEGGILALTALATPITPSGKTERSIIVLTGIFGAALLYGDGTITPAISVLMLFTAWKIFQKGGATGWQGWIISAISLAAMLLKVPERIVVVIMALVGVFFLS